MSRTKHFRLPALILAAAVMIGTSVPASASDGEELYFEALTQQVTTNITTAQAYKGTFEITGNCRANTLYEEVNYVFCTIDSGEVSFVKYEVENGTKVKRGDKIAQVHVGVESVELDELKIQIDTEEENLDNFINVNKALLKQYENLSKNSASAGERRTAQLLYDRLSVSYNEELESRQEALDQLHNRYNEYAELSEVQYITAPSDGTVNGLNWYRNGDKLGNYAYMCQIYNTEKLSFVVRGGSDGLRYNMPVTIVQGSGSSIVNVEGRVTSNRNSILASNLLGTDDYIEITGDPSLLEIGDEVTIRYCTVHMEDAVMVDKKAVHSDGRGSFIYLYENGSSIKKYILAGGMNSEACWIIDGLNEGDTVIIK